MAITEHADYGETPTNVRTVGVKEQLGVGVVALGVFAMLLPWAAQAISDLEFIKSDAYGILAGSVLVLGLFIIAAGVAIVVQKLD